MITPKMSKTKRAIHTMETKTGVTNMFRMLIPSKLRPYYFAPGQTHYNFLPNSHVERTGDGEYQPLTKVWIRGLIKTATARLNKPEKFHPQWKDLGKAHQNRYINHERALLEALLALSPEIDRKIRQSYELYQVVVSTVKEEAREWVDPYLNGKELHYYGFSISANKCSFNIILPSKSAAGDLLMQIQDKLPKYITPELNPLKKEDLWSLRLSIPRGYYNMEGDWVENNDIDMPEPLDLLMGTAMAKRRIRNNKK